MDENQLRLMVAGQIRPKGNNGLLVEIRRCMAVFAADGCELGMVAAVCLDPHTQEVASALLGRLPLTSGYRLIPVSLIDRVHENAVHLSMTAESAEKLVHRRSSASTATQTRKMKETSQ